VDGVSRILIADDHALFRSGLNLLLRRVFPSAEVIEAQDAASTLRALDAARPVDLVLLDLAMPGMETWDALDAIKAAADGAPVVMVSAHQDSASIRASIEAGASGYVLKSFTEDSLRHALALILSGQTYVPTSALFADAAAAAPMADTAAMPGAPLDPENPLHALTKRQHDVLMLLMKGFSNKAIARTLGVYESTVKAHIQVVLQKLGAENRTHAAMIAREWASAADGGAQPRTPAAAPVSGRGGP
jgi:two-component system nitrate/nitrite response regulator NarL